jgi:Protein of unknown function (DUF2721)
MYGRFFMRVRLSFLYHSFKIFADYTVLQACSCILLINSFLYFLKKPAHLCHSFLITIYYNMEITFNTPALLFPAISLLLLAYTNRYLALANLIRKLHDEYIRGEKNHLLLKQIRILRVRINLVRQMQAMGVFSFLCCVVTMYSVYMQWAVVVKYVFAFSLISLLSSLIISLIEISQSTKALELEISDMEELEKGNFFTDIFSKDKEGS